VKHLSENEIQEYLDNTVSTGKQEIITHLDSCQLCRNRVKEYETLFFQLKKAEPAELSPDFAAKMMAKIKAEVPAPSPRPVWSIILSFAGAILGLVTIFYFINITPLLESIKTSRLQEYINQILLSKIEKITGFFDVDITVIIYTGLTLIIIAAIDYIIRHSKRRPISFMV